MIEYGYPEYNPSHIVVDGFRNATKKLKMKSSKQKFASTYRILLPWCESSDVCALAWSAHNLQPSTSSGWEFADMGDQYPANCSSNKSKEE